MRPNHNVIPKGAPGRFPSESGNGISSLMLGQGRRKLFYLEDSKIGSGETLLETADNRDLLNGATARAVSCRHNRDGLLDGFAPVRLVSDFSICVKNQGEGFSKIVFDFGEGFSLRIGARNFLHIAEIPFSLLKVDGGKLPNHEVSVT